MPVLEWTSPSLPWMKGGVQEDLKSKAEVVIEVEVLPALSVAVAFKLYEKPLAGVVKMGEVAEEGLAGEEITCWATTVLEELTSWKVTLFKPEEGAGSKT